MDEQQRGVIEDQFQAVTLSILTQEQLLTPELQQATYDKMEREAEKRKQEYQSQFEKDIHALVESLNSPNSSHIAQQGNLMRNNIQEKHREVEMHPKNRKGSGSEFDHSGFQEEFFNFMENQKDEVAPPTSDVFMLASSKDVEDLLKSIEDKETKGVVANSLRGHAKKEMKLMQGRGFDRSNMQDAKSRVDKYSKHI